MNLFENILSLAIIVILAVSLVVTWVVLKNAKVADGVDSNIGKAVKKNVYSRNPMFLAYAIFFALLLFIVLFAAITFYK